MWRNSRNISIILTYSVIVARDRRGRAPKNYLRKKKIKKKNLLTRTFRDGKLRRLQRVVVVETCSSGRNSCMEWTPRLLEDRDRPFGGDETRRGNEIEKCWWTADCGGRWTTAGGSSGIGVVRLPADGGLRRTADCGGWFEWDRSGEAAGGRMCVGSGRSRVFIASAASDSASTKNGGMRHARARASAPPMGDVPGPARFENPPFGRETRIKNTTVNTTDIAPHPPYHCGRRGGRFPSREKSFGVAGARLF